MVKDVFLIPEHRITLSKFILRPFRCSGFFLFWDVLKFDVPTLSRNICRRLFLQLFDLGWRLLIQLFVLMFYRWRFRPAAWSIQAGPSWSRPSSSFKPSSSLSQKKKWSHRCRNRPSKTIGFLRSFFSLLSCNQWKFVHFFLFVIVKHMIFNDFFYQFVVVVLVGF